MRDECQHRPGMGEAGSALLEAAGALDPGRVALALARGALPDCMGSDRRCALLRAVRAQAFNAAMRERQGQVARLLLEAGARPEGTLSGSLLQREGSALMQAAERGLGSLVKLLLSHGADSQATNEHGQSAAFFCVISMGRSPEENRQTLAELLPFPGWEGKDALGRSLEHFARQAGDEQAWGMVQAHRLAREEAIELRRASVAIQAKPAPRI